jgi:class 3 adenylate cyclase
MLASVRGADIERLLPRITVPTLVVNRTGFPFISRSAARELADSLPDGRYVEVEGADVLPYIGDTDALFGAVEEFLTGTVRGSLMGRYLAATLFTDIVDSTPQSRVLGDTEWRDTLDAHDRLVRRNLIRFSGAEIDTTGDGFFALFDSALSAIKCAIATIPEVTELGLHIRCAVHVAEFDQRGRTPVGIGAHVGARLLSIAGADEVVVSSAVRDVLLGTHLDFEHRGSFALKGVPGSWEVFSAREASHAGPVGRSG